jgi:hypothetical protein
MDAGQTIILDNEWKIARRRVSGENGLEIIGPDAKDTQGLKGVELFTEVVRLKTRYPYRSMNRPTTSSTGF